MFKVTEDTRHGNYRRVGVGAGCTVRSALMSVLKHSPYNSNLDQGKKDALSCALADKKPAQHGWATYTCEYRSDLTGCLITFEDGSALNCGLVLLDEGDSVLVFEYPEGDTPPAREDQDGVLDQRLKDAAVRIGTASVRDFTAPPTDEEAAQMIAALKE